MDRTSAPLAGESVIYQNWLMKRSQMTRVFKRRFTILTANGKLYSFRKADLSKPETLVPAHASLVWDIRGCQVELAPKLGRHTWLLKPTSSSPLKEEIVLRTCCSSPVASCIFWMQIMSAVAKNNIALLYEEISTLTLETDLRPKPDCVLFAEVEGSLYPLPLETPSRIEIPIRSTDPGSCLLLMEFSPGSEVSDGVSAPIPRYRYHKSKTTLPWTIQRPQAVALKTTSGSVVSTGTVSLSINEGLRDYAEPLVIPTSPDSDHFDFALFKFQIKRLIRIIDKIGDLKDEIAAVIEWEIPRKSALWLVYLTFVLLVVPRYLAIIFLIHFSFYSLSKSADFTEWWSTSATRMKIQVWLDRYGISLSSEAKPRKDSIPPATVSSPSVQPRIAASPTSPSERTSLQAAAASAISAITKTAHPPPFSLKAEIWENQRRNLGGSQFSASNLSVFDRSRWSDVSGKVALDPPSATQWKIDIDAPNSDDNGWSYNTRWGASADWHAEFNSWDFVRKRRWIPAGVAFVSTPSSAQSPPLSMETDPSSLMPAPLSAVQTSSAEYGNIQGDYDQTNLENQPKLTSFGSMFSEFKSTAARAQFVIGDICSDIERWLSLFSWRDELISVVATGALVVIAIALIFVPMNIIAFAVVIGLFNLGYRRSRWRNVAVQVALKQHVLPLLPEGTSPNKLSGIDAHRLCLAINKRTGLDLTQKLLADMENPHDVAMWICKNSPAFSQYRKWMKRDWIENFMDHVPPEVSTEMHVFLTDVARDRVISHAPAPSSSVSSEEAPEEASFEASLISETL